MFFQYILSFTNGAKHYNCFYYKVKIIAGEEAVIKKVAIKKIEGLAIYSKCRSKLTQVYLI